MVWYTSELLSCTLQLRWEDNTIFVTKHLEGTDCIGLVMNVFLDLWRFRKFTDSRWLQTGTCGRSFTAALLTGIESCVEHIRGDPASSDYFIGGFARLGCPEKAFLAQAAVVSRVSDAVHVLLMEDGRVLSQLDALKEAMEDEMQWMVNLPPFFWSTVASICSMAPHEVRQKALDAGHTCIGFFHYRVFAAAQERPWSLASGNVPGNLDGLRMEDEPLEPTTRKIWLQLRAGLPRKMIERQVRLLRDVCWSSLPAEQLHGTAAGIRRHHPEYTVDTLMARANVMSTNQLMPKPSHDDVKIEQLQKKVAAIKRKCPNKAGGRQIYIKELHEVAREQLENSGQSRPPNFATRVMQGHAAAYARKSLKVRSFYDMRAKAAALRKEAEHQEEVEHLKAAVGLRKARAAEVAQQRPPLVLRDCHWGDAEFASFAEKMADPSYSAASVARRRAALAVAPALCRRSPRLQAMQTHHLHTLLCGYRACATAGRASRRLLSCGAMGLSFRSSSSCLLRAHLRMWALALYLRSPRTSMQKWQEQHLMICQW